jgi:predicted RNA-binding Zn ribbon-like protein
MSPAYGGAMTPSEILRTNYRPIGGVLCLDFANTVDWHDSERRVELLADAECLAAWARIAGGSEIAPDDADLGCARELRDAVWQAFRARVKGQPVPGGTIAVINRNLELAPEARRLRVSDGDIVWGDRAVRGVDALLGAIARSAAELLTDPDRLARVRMCAGEGCGWLFLDESRGARRRWCSMQGCGNRAKGRAHYRRKAKLTQV